MVKCNAENLEIVSSIHQTIYMTKILFHLHEPKFCGNEKKYLNDCIDSTFVSSVGKFVDQFEEQMTQNFKNRKSSCRS